MATPTTVAPADLLKALTSGTSAAEVKAPEGEVKVTEPLASSVTAADIVQPKEGGQSYQFPSAPTTFEFASGRRIAIPDGVFTTSDPEEIKELDKCVRAGIIYPFNGELYSPFAKPAAPLNPTVTN
jgi:hypothetical protein